MEIAKQKEHWTIRAILFPGEWACNYFKVKGDDNRMLLRLYLNLAIYAKVAGTVAYLYVA